MNPVAGTRKSLDADLPHPRLQSGEQFRYEIMVAFAPQDQCRRLDNGRLERSAPGQWVLKGGMALEVRFGDRARATKDLDLAFREREAGRKIEKYAEYLHGQVRESLAGVMAAGKRVELQARQLESSLGRLEARASALLAEGDPQSPVTLSFEIHEGGVRTRIGPLRDTALAEALQGPEPPPGELTLPRILSTVVDSYGVEEVANGHLVVRLEKLVRRQ